MFTEKDMGSSLMNKYDLFEDHQLSSIVGATKTRISMSNKKEEHDTFSASEQTGEGSQVNGTGPEFDTAKESIAALQQTILVLQEVIESSKSDNTDSAS
jgi:hypothetical protein